MPRLRDSAIQLDPQRYRPIEIAGAAAVTAPHIPTPLPRHLTQSPLLISSMPSIVSGVDGINRQFYGYARLPIQRGASLG